MTPIWGQRQTDGSASFPLSEPGLQMAPDFGASAKEEGLGGNEWSISRDQGLSLLREKSVH